MKPSSTGIGFSHQSVPSLSKTATRSSRGTDCAADSAKETIASFAAPSFQDSSVISHSAARRGLVQRVLFPACLLERLVDAEARRPRSRRELLERLQVLAHEPDRRQD